MPSDISLAVGDGARRMTYAELAAVRGISALSAERLVRRRHWPRQTGNDGIVRVLVPLTEARKVGGNRRVSSPGHPPLTSAAPTPDIRGVIREVIREVLSAAPPDDRDDDRALESANAALREMITAHEATIRDLRTRLDTEVEERRRVQERLTGLLTHRQAGSVPAVQRLEAVSNLQRPWWRRWFRK
jgi:hypothetical protein